MTERENELFEEWWESEGQYNRAGGGDYEKTFAYYAWMAVVNRQGCKLVSVEPTWKMIDVGENACYGDDEEICKTVYKAMLGAVDE